MCTLSRKWQKEEVYEQGEGVSNSETGEGGRSREAGCPPYHQGTMGVYTALSPWVILPLLGYTAELTSRLMSRLYTRGTVRCTVRGPQALFGINPWVGGIAAPLVLQGVTVGRDFCAELLCSSRH